MKSVSIVQKLRSNPRSLRKFVIGLTIGGGAIAFLGIQWYKLESSLPKNVEEVITYARPETLTIKASDETVLAEFGPVTHETLKLSEIPPLIQEAFIAIEDSRYQKHQGVDYQGIVRAAFANLKAGKLVEGGSTITQQLARIVYLDQQRSWERKIKEFIIAQRIESQLTKEQILEKYLNLVYLGSGAYGIADAAHVYFSKPIDQLTLPEMATLAGITPAPSLYSPLENTEAAKVRRDLVLTRMAEEGFISVSEAEIAIASELKLQASPPQRLARKAPYFVEYIQKQLPNYVSPEQLQKGGIVVETTLNAEWQEVAENIIKKQVERYGKWQRFEQGALVAINPYNGAIKVMVGGTEFEDNQYNRVTQAQRQPGSTFKTFVYAAAISTGMTPYKAYLDAPYIVDGYQPKNYGNKYRGSHIPIYQALTSSVNVVAVQALIDTGWNPIINLAKKMGIESELKSTYSLALGASEVNLLELTSAYGTLANQGIHQQSYGINRILDSEGNVIYRPKFPNEKAIDPDAANITTWMLRKVVNNGTGIPAQIGRPVAGKTGTSDQSRDLWFIGYIPQLVTGVWLGNDDNKPTYGTSGIAAAIWRSFMLEAVKEMPIETFNSPPGKLTVKEASLEAEPIKPKKSYHQKVITTSASRSTRTRTSQRTYRRSYSRRRSYSNTRTRRTTTPKRTTSTSTVKNNTPAINKAPKAVQKTTPSVAPVLNKPSKSKE